MLAATTTDQATTPADEALAAGHPLQQIEEMTRDGLAPMVPLFSAMAPTWSIGPDRAIRCVLLMALYGIGNEALFCEELDRNRLFRWFLGMSPEEAGLEPVQLAQMHTRLSRNAAATEFFQRLIGDAGRAGLLADDRFSPDARQIQAWSLRPPVEVRA
jgi:transposase